MKRFIDLLELGLRNGIVYPLLRIFLRNLPVTTPIDLATIRSVLILRYDKIGDMVVTIPVFRILKSRNPRLFIGVVTSESNAEIVEGEKSVDACFVLFKNPVRLVGELWRIRSAHFDVVLNFIFNRTTSGALLANLCCPRAVKIGQGAEKYRFYFNVLVSLPRASMQMLDILTYYVETVFGIHVDESERRLQLTIDREARDCVGEFLRERSLVVRGGTEAKRSQYVVLNLSAREDAKRITFQQGLAMARFLANEESLYTIVVSAPEDIAERKRVVDAVDSPRCFSFPPSENASMKEIVALISGAVCLISPDTSVIHIASATSTPVLGIFTPLQVNQEWLPYKVQHALVIAPFGKPVSDIGIEVLIKEITEFLRVLRTTHTHQGPEKVNV